MTANHSAKYWFIVFGETGVLVDLGLKTSCQQIKKSDGKRESTKSPINSPGEDISVVTAEVEDAGHKIYPLKVEYVGKVSGFDWLTQVVIRLPDDFLNAGDVLVCISLRGAVSNKAIIGIR